MFLFVNEHLMFLLSLNHLSIYLIEILKESQFRTVMFYYENDTAFIATNLLNIISNSNNLYFSYTTYNIDENRRTISNSSNNMGTDLFNICVFDGISKRLDFYRKVFFDPRFQNIYLSQQNATDQQISNFFRHIWEFSILNAGLIFWTGSIRIYTHFPYHQKFAVKVFDSDANVVGTEMILPNKTIFKTLFFGKSDNLRNTTFKVFINTDPPKVFPTPDRFRSGSKFYFNGRDGVMARHLEHVLNARWHYYTTPAYFRLFNFANEKASYPDYVSRDLFGKQSISDLIKTNNVEVINITETENFEQR